MIPLLLTSIDNWRVNETKRLALDSFTKLELLVQEVGKSIIKSVEDDMRYAMEVRQSQLESLLASPNPDSMRQRQLENTINTISDFFGTVELEVDKDVVKINSSNPVILDTLDRGSSTVPKLGPSNLIHSRLVIQAKKEGIHLG